MTHLMVSSATQVMKNYIENIHKIIEYDVQEHEDWYLEDFVLGATKYKQLTKKYIKQNNINKKL